MKRAHRIPKMNKKKKRAASAPRLRRSNTSCGDTRMSKRLGSQSRKKVGTLKMLQTFGDQHYKFMHKMNNDADFFKKNEKRIDYKKKMKKSLDYKYDPIIGKSSFNKSRQQFQKRINDFQRYLDQTY